jgi:hypothetical protein
MTLSAETANIAPAVGAENQRQSSYLEKKLLENPPASPKNTAKTLYNY